MQTAGIEKGDAVDIDGDTSPGATGDFVLNDDVVEEGVWSDAAAERLWGSGATEILSLARPQFGSSFRTAALKKPLSVTFSDVVQAIDPNNNLLSADMVGNPYMSTLELQQKQFQQTPGYFPSPYTTDARVKGFTRDPFMQQRVNGFNPNMYLQQLSNSNSNMSLLNSMPHLANKMNSVFPLNGTNSYAPHPFNANSFPAQLGNLNYPNIGSMSTFPGNASTYPSLHPNRNSYLMNTNNINNISNLNNLMQNRNLTSTLENVNTFPSNFNLNPYASLQSTVNSNIAIAEKQLSDYASNYNVNTDYNKNLCSNENYPASDNIEQLDNQEYHLPEGTEFLPTALRSTQSPGDVHFCDANVTYDSDVPHFTAAECSFLDHPEQEEHLERSQRSVLDDLSASLADLDLDSSVGL